MSERQRMLDGFMTLSYCIKEFANLARARARHAHLHVHIRDARGIRGEGKERGKVINISRI